MYCCKEWTGRCLGEGGKEGVCVCVCVREEARRVSPGPPQGPDEERTEKHPIRDPLAGAGRRRRAAGGTGKQTPTEQLIGCPADQEGVRVEHAVLHNQQGRPRSQVTTEIRR